MQAKWDQLVKKNNDKYGQLVVNATVKVCRLLDQKKTAAQAADGMRGNGISGFGAGCVAMTVGKYHPRGDEFRQWWKDRSKAVTESVINKIGVLLG